MARSKYCRHILYALHTILYVNGKRSLWRDTYSTIFHLNLSFIILFVQNMMCIILKTILAWFFNQNAKYLKEIHISCSKCIKRFRVWCERMASSAGFPYMLSRLKPRALKSKRACIKIFIKFKITLVYK